MPHGVTGDIIGRGGATINGIQTDTGCRINLQRDSGRCQITGPNPEAMQAAKVCVCAGGCVRGYVRMCMCVRGCAVRSRAGCASASVFMPRTPPL